MSGETVRKKNLQFTLLCREISGSLGRYLALFAIVALGVGFFSGLKICKPRMLETGIQYLENQNFYDFKAVSEIGLGEKEVEAFRNADFTAQAEGAYSLDLLYVDEKGSDGVAKAHSLTKEINKVSLTAGRMPEKSGECLADARYSAEEDLGKTFTLSENNSEATQGALAHTEFTVVGLVYSPLYLNYERGSTALGKGRVDCFLYLLPEEFLSDSYTEVYLTVNQEAQAYSEDYKKEIESFRIQAESLEKALLDQRKEELVFLYRSVLLSLDLSPEQAGAAVLPEKLQSPQAYLLDRNTNVGYVCFENDASIVEGVSRVFPAFFFLVAALVCATTMTRMVNDHRTRIGTLKALGYGNSSIAGLYLLYAGSAALFGAILGYFLGTSLIPTIIWKVYEIMYGRFSALLPVFDGVLLLVSLLAALLCSVGTAYVCCRTELRENPASLIRPKTPKAGKKIFLERLRPLWRKMSFLHKVSARNILRYKKRLFMMIIGIGGCTALLLTGFGIRDSISDLADEQYEKITVYDYSVSFSSALEGEERKAFEEQCAKAISKILYLSESSGDCSVGEVTKSVYLIVPEDVEVPVGLEQDMIIVKMPADKTYVASDEILEQMKELDLLDSVAAVGMEQKACTVPEIAEKMQVNEDEDEADAEVIYGGSFEKPELKALVKKEVSLALLPGELLPRDTEDAEKNDDAKTVSTKKDSAKTEDKKTKEQSTGDSDELTVEEQTERLEEITEKFALLGIPVIIDRSADEKTELAQYEWIKVYGVLFGCEEKMDKMFEKAVDEAGVQENQ